MYQAVKEGMFVVRPNLRVDDIDINAVGGNILIICLHAAFWTIMLILIEARAFRWVDSIFNCCRGKKIPERTDLVLDEDVVEEENRVDAISKDDIKVRVNKFRKVYT